MSKNNTKETPKKEAAKGGKEKEKEAAKPEKAPLDVAIALLRLAASENEPRYAGRALRKLTVIRTSVSGGALRAVIERELSVHDDVSFASVLPEELGVVPMETESGKKKEEAANAACAELETFFHLLVVVRLLDDKRHEEASKSATELVAKVRSFVRPTLTPVAAKAFFYLSRAAELLGGEHYAAVRPILLNAHITAGLQHANEAQLTILNLLLRNFLHHSLYAQADKLSSKSSRVTTMLSDGSVSNNQIARYLHYQGRIKAVQLAYGTAFEYLEESLRKAPRETALGFRLATHKFLIIVQLLMGEIPERSLFAQTELAGALRPYFLLARAVRLGDLESYNKAVSTYSASFARDDTHALVVRLRHNVIKTGLRKINLAYARISFEDICEKLRLESPKDAEYVVAKAIRDGVVEATIDHSGKFMQSRAGTKLYSTAAPYEQFHKRIEFCLNIRNEAVRAMRFPDSSEKPDVLKKEEPDDKKKSSLVTEDVDESAALDELDDEDE